MKGLEVGSGSKSSMNKGASILDFILRILGFICTLGSAIIMGTTNETLPFFTRFIRFRAEYDDLPTFTLFVVANSMVSGYLAVSLPVSIYHVIRSTARNSRLVLVFFDTAMLVVVTGGASASASIVELAHNGNARANWFPICQQFNSFCERISGSLIGSFGGMLLFILIILVSGITLSRH